MLSDRTAFAIKLRALARFHDKTLTAEDVERYWTCLSERLTDERFAAACAQLERGEWFPTPARILAAVPRRSPDTEAAAVRLYEKVRGCQSWNAEVGTIYDEREIAWKCGTFAAAVFVVAGGALAFRGAIVEESQEPWLRKAWVAAYWALLDDPMSVPAITQGERKVLPVVSALAERLSADHQQRAAADA